MISGLGTIVPDRIAQLTTYNLHSTACMLCCIKMPCCTHAGCSCAPGHVKKIMAIRSAIQIVLAQSSTMFCVQGAHVSTLPAFTFGMAHTQDISFLTEAPRQQQQQQASRRAVKPLDLSRIRQNDAARGAFLGRVQTPQHAAEAGSTAAPSSVPATSRGNLEGQCS